MSGIPGSGGPPPKRSDQRRRRNKVEIDRAPADGEWGEPLEPAEHSETALRFWEALRHSGQAQFYQASDWAAAELVVIAIDAFAKKPSAVMLASINSAMSSLLVTEGDRRRMRLELERQKAPGDEIADVSELSYRRRLKSG